MNGSFEKFSQDVLEDSLHRGNCAVRWLEALTVSPDATYTTEPWAKEFLQVVTGIIILYEQSLLGRVKSLFTNDSFIPTESVAMHDIEVYPSLKNLILVRSMYF